MGIAYAPTKVKSPSGWLWAWAFAIEIHLEEQAGRPRVREVGDEQGLCPAREREDRQLGRCPLRCPKVAVRERRLQGLRKGVRAGGRSLNTVDPLHATNFPDTPYTGIQYVQIHEFQDLGTKCTQEFAAAISAPSRRTMPSPSARSWRRTLRSAAAGRSASTRAHRRIGHIRGRLGPPPRAARGSHP